MDLKNLETQVASLEERLSILEKTIKQFSSAETSFGSSPEPGNKATPPSRSWGDLEPINQTSVQSVIEDSAIDKSTDSGNWLGIIATVCFVLAAGFIIKLSIETGWLTPQRQIIIASLLGMVLIVAGLVLLDTYRGYASLLPASGIIILYLSVFAGHRFYELTSFNMALLMTNLVSILSIWLYWKIRHDVYAIVAATGVYIAPIILDLHYASQFTVYYFLCCSLAFALISIWTRSRLLTILSAYLAILSTFLIGLELHHNLTIAIALALHFLIFAIGTYFYSIYHRQQLAEYEAWAFFPVLILFYALEYYLIDSLSPRMAPWFSLLFAGLLIGLYLVAKKKFPHQQINSQSMIYAFASLVLFHSFYLELLPPYFKPWLFVIILLAYALFPERYVAEGKNKAFYIPVMVLLFILAIEYFNIIFQLMQGYTLSLLLVSAAAFTCIWLTLFMHQDEVYKKEEYGILALGSAHVMAIVGLYRIADSHGSLAVTSCWLLYAIVIMGFAYNRRDKFMAHSALLVLGLAAGKALLYDASMTPTAVRILCLLLTGAVLYGAGFLMKKIAEWDS